MKGAPLIRLALVVLALLLLALPLRRLTSRTSASPVAAAPATAASTVELTLSSTRAPFHFLITHLGKTIWEGNSSDLSVARQLSLPFPREGIELWAEASWEGDAPAALKAELQRDHRVSPPRILWGNGQAEDILHFR